MTLTNHKALILMLTSLALFVSVGLAQSPPKSWADDAEKELATAASSEQDLTKRLPLLEQWKQEYPDSEYKMERYVFLLTAYQGLGLQTELEETARQLVAIEALTGSLYVCMLAPGLIQASPEMVNLVAQAAGSLITQATLVMSGQSAGMNESQWAVTKAALQAAAYKALGWVGTQRSDFTAAETAYTKALGFAPTDASMSGLLGMALLQQKDPEKEAAVVYHFMRAAFYEGPGALPEDTRSALGVKLTELLSNAGWESEQLEQLKTTARVNPLPPQNLSLTTTQPAPAAATQPANPPAAYQTQRPTLQPEIESFESYYRRRKPKFSALGDMARGAAAGRNGTRFVSTRDRLYEEWLAEQQLKVLQGR